MKKYVLSAFLILSCFMSYAQTPPAPGNWALSFQEEFEGSELDPDKWTLGGRNLGFNGLSGNSSQNITVQNGNLEFLAEKRNGVFAGKNHTYFSGEITTFKKFRQLYGYFETRVKYDAVQGMWPAFWTMPDRGNYGEADLEREIYMRFDLSGVSENVTSAKLKIKVSELPSPDSEYFSNITVHSLLSDNWNENTITWNSKPQFDPLWFRQITGTNRVGYVNEIYLDTYLEIDVTDYINTQVGNGAHAGFALIDNYMRHELLKLFSKETANQDGRPFLQIDGNTIFPSDDAHVRNGAYADDNFGASAEMEIMDSWVRTASTYEGGMEIDIMESLGIWGDNYTQHALHWDGYDEDHKSIGTPKINFPATDDGYHVYGMLWQPGLLEFYIDGIKTWTYNNIRVPTVDSYLLLSLQLGGWDGNENLVDGVLPAKMHVDWVRIYEAVTGIPECSLTGPTEGVNFLPTSDVTLTADAREVGGTIEKVEFYEGQNLIGTDDTSPYSFTWTNVSRGTYALTAKAISTSTASKISDAVNITVTNAPVVTITSPADNADFTSPVDITIEANASSEGAVSKVDFYQNNELIGSVDTSPYSYSWTNVSAGVYELKVEVTDDLGATSTDIINVNVAGAALPAPWKNQDIGIVYSTGQAYFADGAFTLIASGKDIWKESDNFHFAYQEIKADGEMVARVVSATNTHEWAKSGVMIRESLESGSINAFMSVTQAKGTYFTHRVSTGVESTGDWKQNTLAAPYWVKVARVGDVFTGYDSPNGTTWTEMGTATINMNSNVLIGLATTPIREDTEMITAVFDNVTVQDTLIITSLADDIELIEGVSVNIYPNPALDNEININLKGYNDRERLLVSISDLNGRAIYKSDAVVGRNGNLKFNISLSDKQVSAGVFVLSVIGNKSAIHKQFIIK